MHVPSPGVTAQKGGSVPSPKSNGGSVPLLCRLGRHKWSIWFVAANGHQSYRERRCVRCLHVTPTFERQQLSYFLKPIGSWVRQ